MEEQTTETPESAGAAPGQGNGSADTLRGSQDGAPESSAGASAQPVKDDYKARLRSEHDFAVKEAESHQSRADRLAGEMRQTKEQLGELEDWLPKLGGGQNVMAILRHYMQHPQAQQFLSELGTNGQIATPILAKPTSRSDDDDDEYREPWQDETETLKQKIQRLEGQLANYGKVQGAERFGGFVKKHLSRYPDLTEEERSKLENRVDSQIARMNAEQLHTLSENDVRVLIRAGLSDEEWDSIDLRRAQRLLREQQGRSTDSPSGVAPRGNESPAVDRNQPFRQQWQSLIRTRPDLQ